MLIPFSELFKKYNIKTDGVLHLGANTGQEAEAYQAQGIENIIWVEAIPDVYAKLREHVKPFGHTALLACLADKDGAHVDFNIASNEGQSSSFLEFGTHTKEHPTVHYTKKIKLTTIRCDTLIKSYGLEAWMTDNWFLNVDLQGAELLALKGMGSLLNKFAYAYIEVNVKELYKGCPMIQEIDSYLAAFGFGRKETKMTGNGWGDALYIRD